MSEGDPRLKHKIVEVLMGDKTVIVASGVGGVAASISGVNTTNRGIHTIEDAVIVVGSWGFALGSGAIIGWKLSQIEKRNRR